MSHIRTTLAQGLATLGLEDVQKLLAEAMKNNLDRFSYVAASLLEKPIGEVTTIERSEVKVLLFAYNYGGPPK